MSAHLEWLASRPRPVGSAANHEAREYCANHLRSLGFAVAERPFEFSALPGRHAARIIGVTAAAGFAATWAMNMPRLGALTALIVAALTIWLGGRRATRRRWLREPGVNLEAQRGGSPRVWLVAHIDSKSQPISSAVRTLGVIAVVAAAVGIMLSPMIGVGFASACGIAGGLILSFAAVRSRSPGAADNASGVVAVLEAAALVPRDRGLGVLITDAEELALAGAAAWAEDRQPGIAINCDTIDDDGHLVVFRYGPSGATLPAAAQQAATAQDPGARLMRPLPGVLTDSDAFHKAGWATVTLGRGTIRTLNRIHTERDSLDSMRGTGIPAAARVLARLAEELA